MFAKKALFAAGVVLFGAIVAAHATPPKTAAERAQFESAIKTLGVKAEDLKDAPVAGLLEVSANGLTGYMTADGRYFIRGDIFEVATRVNVTQQRRQEQTKRELAALDEKDMIVFSPAQPKYTVTVFTDVDCSYCRKLHGEMAKLNELGIKVRYLAYPRSGPNTESWSAMEAVWCSKDPKDAITRAKLGEKIEAAKCDKAPLVDSQYKLGGKFGVGGTPAVFAEDGRQLGGYVPPQQLLTMLDTKPDKVAAAKQGN